MAINFAPKVGQVLQCHFGDFPMDANGQRIISVNGRLMPEMVKNRLVVVLNGRMDACIVVPLSTTFDPQRTSSGHHVEINERAIPGLAYFTEQARWAKADMVQQVSNKRLDSLRGLHQRLVIHLDRATVELVQRAVIKSVSASSLLVPPPAPLAPPAAAHVAVAAATAAPSEPL